MYPTPVIVLSLYTQLYECEVNGTAYSHGRVPLIYLNIYNMTVEAGTSGDTDLYSEGTCLKCS
jgi:hypothetical protein